MRTKTRITIKILAALACLASAVWLGIAYNQNFRGIWPAVLPPVSVSVSPTAGTTTPLTAATGYTVSLLTDKVPGARDLALDQFGNVWVSQTGQGMVSLVYLKDAPAGTSPEVSVILKGLRNPHGLAFDPSNPTTLYIATETAVNRLPTYSDGALERVAALPAGGRHFTRSLLFGTDGRLYVSIGSTCDVCREKNPENGSIISMNKDGTDRQLVASGLRNSVFMTKEPGSGGIWATEMGRDFLGDNLPPDEVNVILAGKNYGWPICYGQRIHDTQFDKNQYIRDPCADTTPPVIEIPAHSAPLGLAFLGQDLLVAYHGSWNRTIPTGYKVVRWHFSFGTWQQSDFLTGFLNGSSAIGRPTGLLVMPDGSVLVADDKSGSIWRVSPVR